MDKYKSYKNNTLYDKELEAIPANIDTLYLHKCVIKGTIPVFIKNIIADNTWFECEIKTKNIKRIVSIRCVFKYWNPNKDENVKKRICDAQLCEETLY